MDPISDIPTPSLKSHRLTRRKFLRYGVLGASLLAAGAYVEGRHERDWIKVTQVSLTLPRLPEAFDGFRLAQFSDIHMDDWMNRSRLQEIVGLVNEQQPDLICITGDFVTFQPKRFAEDLVSALSELSAKEGAVAILGNHDHWTNPEIVKDVLKESKIRDLNNRVFTLERGRNRLHIAGVDDIWVGKQRLDDVTAKLPSNEAAILLAHEPDYADVSAPTGRFDLQISGHSHGGQVQLPLIGPLHVPHLAKKYPSGRYRIGDMVLYTNRRVGMVGPHFRFDCRPEITVFTLRSPA
jgi:hypothetical protein